MTDLLISPDVFLEPLPVPGKIVDATRYIGESWIPQDVKRRRRMVLDALRRVGTPVVIKHMYNDQDAKEGRARKSPTLISAYGQPRHDDPISNGVGFVGTEDSPNEWYNANTGALLTASVSPGAGWVAAPLHRGFGPGYLTYIIEPDTAEDLFKITPTGVLIKTQTATAQAGWYPEMNDNDLLTNVTIDSSHAIVDTHERYQLKMVNPISIRGHQRHGRRENRGDGNRFLIGQSFEMTLIPPTDVLYKVSIDR